MILTRCWSTIGYRLTLDLIMNSDDQDSFPSFWVHEDVRYEFWHGNGVRSLIRLQHSIALYCIYSQDIGLRLDETISDSKIPLR